MRQRYALHVLLCSYCSAVQSRKSWVVKRTIHAGSLGGPCYIWVVRIYWCGQKWQWNNNFVMWHCDIYFQPVTKKREIGVSNTPIARKFDRWPSSHAVKPRLSYLKVIGVFQDATSQLREFKRHERSSDKASYNMHNFVNRGPVSMSHM